MSAYLFRTRSRHLNRNMHVRTKDSLRIAFERSFWWKKGCHTRGRNIDLVGDFLFVQFGVLSKKWKHLKIHPKKLGRECTLLSLSQIYGRKTKIKNCTLVFRRDKIKEIQCTRAGLILKNIHSAHIQRKEGYFKYKQKNKSQLARFFLGRTVLIARWGTPPGLLKFIIKRFLFLKNGVCEGQMCKRLWYWNSTSDTLRYAVCEPDDHRTETNGLIIQILDKSCQFCRLPPFAKC